MSYDLPRKLKNELQRGEDPSLQHERSSDLSVGQFLDKSLDASDDWRPIGRFDFNGRGDFWMKFLPEQPGLYRLRFGKDTYYVGQAKSIHRRLGDYYQPGQGIEVEHRISRALHKFGADVEVITGVQFASLRIRRKKETAEIEALEALGFRVLNGNCVANLQDRIEYHLEEIHKFEGMIAALMAEKAKV